MRVPNMYRRSSNRTSRTPVARRLCLNRRTRSEWSSKSRARGCANTSSSSPCTGSAGSGARARQRGPWRWPRRDPSLGRPAPALVARPRAFRAASRATSACSSTRVASLSSAAPASVNETRRWLRSNSRTPSSCSSFRTCSLTAGCAICSRSAARRKCNSSATATKYLWCRSSMFSHPFQSPRQAWSSGGSDRIRVALLESLGEPRMHPGAGLNAADGAGPRPPDGATCGDSVYARRVAPASPGKTRGARSSLIADPGVASAGHCRDCSASAASFNSACDRTINGATQPPGDRPGLSSSRTTFLSRMGPRLIVGAINNDPRPDTRPG
jgi:hypothetical protein